MSEAPAGARFGDGSVRVRSFSSLRTAIVFGLLLAVQFAAAALTPVGADGPDAFEDRLSIAVLGASLAWPPLLAIWAVFGPRRVFVRLSLTLWLAVAVSLSAAYGFSRNAGESGAEVLLIVAAWLLAYGVFQPPLWLIRALRRWRLERIQPGAACAAEAGGASARSETSQYSLRALLGWILAAAALLGAYRAIAPQLDLEAETAIQLGFESALVGLHVALGGLPVIALAWIVLADGRRRALRIVLSAIILLGLAGACCLSGTYVAGFVLDLPEVLETLLLEAGALVNGLAALLVLRSCGYRLRRRSMKLAEAAPQTPSAPAPLSRMRFACALAPLALLAAGLASRAPRQFEIWRQAEIRSDWRHGNMEAAFAADGAIQRLEYNEPAAISDNQCRRIAQVATLQELSLAGSEIDDRQLALLAALRLESLDLSSTKITDAGLKQLEQFPHLVSLRLSNTAISDAGLKHLKALTKLKELSVFLTDVSDDGLSALDSLLALETLDAQLTAVTVAGAERLRRSHPTTKIAFGASDALLSSTKVYRTYYVQATAGNAIVDQPIKLKKLHARGKASANGVTAALTDAGLASLTAEQTGLEELDLRESAVTDQGIMTLSALRKLKRLDLRGSPVTEQGVQKLARALPECEILR